jgi:hypothetical protein
VRLVQLLDLIRELATTPVLETMNYAAVRGNERFVALDHRRDLFTLVRMDDKNDFIMAHAHSSWLKPPAMRTVEQGGKAGDYSPLELDNQWLFLLCHDFATTLPTIPGIELRFIRIAWRVQRV